MGVDYKDFLRFTQAVDKMYIQLPKFLEKFLLKKALEALRLTKENTPVDTENLKDNWYLSEVERKGSELVVYLINKVEYASYVEYGHYTPRRKSFVPGVYMSTLSIQEVQDSMPAELEASFYNFTRKLGVA